MVYDIVTIIVSIVLILLIAIVLLIVQKWNRENNQPSLRETMKDNIKKAKEILRKK